MTDADAVRAHLAQLAAVGMPAYVIARAAGLRRTTIVRILDGRTSRVQARTARQILAIPVPSPRPVDATGSARRLQALMAMGHRSADVARLAGVEWRFALAVMSGAIRELDGAAASRIAGVYEGLLDTPGGFPCSREKARRRRWAGPAEWDGADIDDPAAAPGPAEVIDEFAVGLAVSGIPVELTKPEQVEAARILHAEHMRSLTVTAGRVGVSDRTVLRWKQAGWSRHPAGRERVAA
jgi:hypothetical protein